MEPVFIMPQQKSLPLWFVGEMAMKLSEQSVCMDKHCIPCELRRKYQYSERPILAMGDYLQRFRIK